MRLVGLAIHQLPGLEPCRVEGLDPKVNFVTGPNGVGKSSLVRALWHLLSGHRSGDPAALSLEAWLEDDTGAWHVRRTGRQCVWARDGEPSDPPPLPDQDLLHCYWLHVEDLLHAATSDDQKLLTRLRSELAGGFDLEVVRANGFDFGPRIGHKEGQALRSARAERRRVEEDYRQLMGKAADRPRLEGATERARSAGLRAQRIQQALTLLAAQRERQRLDHVLASYPEAMARLQGNELAQLAELEADRDASGQQLETQRQRRDDAAAQYERIGFATGLPEDSTLRAQEKHLEELRRISDQIKDQQGRLDKASATEQHAGTAFNQGAERIPSLSPDSVQEAERLGKDLEKARTRHTEHQAQLQAHDARAVSAGGDPLRVQLPWLSGAVILGASIALGTAASAALWPTLIASLVALGAGAWLLALGFGLGGPSHEAIEAALRSRQREATQGALKKAERELERCQAERQRFCAAHGLDPELFQGASLDRFVRLASELDRARSERAGIANILMRLASERDAKTEEIRSFLATWRATPAASDLATLEAGLSTLRRDYDQATAAMTAYTQAERDIARHQASIEAYRQRIEALYASAGLDAGDRPALEARCQAHEAWVQYRRQRDNAVSIETERHTPLREETALLERVANADEHALEQERVEQQALAETYDDLRETLSQLQTRLQDTGKEGKLEQAIAAENEAQDALNRLFDEAMVAEAGQFLIDDIGNQYRTQHEPAVLRDARKRFAAFTHHSWSLQIDTEHGFQARDNKSGERRRLNELSSGTRMQLLLAVRVAWARQIEREKTALPLFLDEALTTTDEARFGEVARSLHELAQTEGRQVFYISARRQEATLWSQATGASPRLVDLAEVRFGQPPRTPEEFAIRRREPLPPPQHHTPAQYAAAIHAPPVAPREPAEALHIFHLCRDELALLHRLMEEWRIQRLGELEALLSSEAASAALPNADARETLQRRCRTARVWITLWRRGRGTPVDRVALERSGAVSHAFINRVTGLGEELDGDGAALIRALRAGEVAQFRKKTTNALEAWLQENGYISSETPFTAEERLRQTLQAMGDTASPGEIRDVVEWLEHNQEDTRRAAEPSVPGDTVNAG